MPQSMQASFSLKSMSCPSIRLIRTMPSASLAANSTESAMRWRKPSFMTSRSTTTSMSCFLYRSSVISSAKSRISPFTRTRTNPCFRKSSNNCRYSPLRPRTTGARICNFAPSGSARILSTICCAVCDVIGLPHCQQCGLPTRAKSRRR